jgi:hypothetical protein
MKLAVHYAGVVVFVTHVVLTHVVECGLLEGGH